MLIDRFMPTFDVSEYHVRHIAAPADRTYDIVRGIDMMRSPLVKVLFGLRRVPQFFTGNVTPIEALTFDALIENGFVLLAEEPGVEVVLGAVGTFWKPTGGIEPIPADAFEGFDRPGYAKATMNLRVEPEGDRGCLVSTETRVVGTDDTSRRKFAAYWRLIGPFSALIRVQMLSLVEKDAAALTTA